MGLLRRIARVLLWPVRRLLDPRFAGVNTNVDFTREKIREDIDVYATTSAESLTYVGEQIAAVEAQLRRLERRQLTSRAEELGEGGLERLTLPDLDPTLAALLNHELGPHGFAAQADLWFNPPVWLEYREGAVEVRAVNERIAELPFAFAALARLRPPARVLDVGSSESTFPLSLASLGYEVTAVDFRPIRLRHPSLEVVQERFEEWRAEPGSFDAVSCISTIEHFGVDEYGAGGEDEGADLRALARMRELLKPEGLLVLTVPYGTGRPGPAQRVYDDERLGRLLAGWELEERRLVTRVDRRTWAPLGEEEAGASGGESAALIVARPAR